MSYSPTEATVALPKPFHPDPKRRRTNQYTSYKVDPIYGPVREQRPESGHGTIYMSAENNLPSVEQLGLFSRIKNHLLFAFSEPNDIVANQVKYSAEHENVAGDEKDNTRVNAINRLRNTVPELIAYGTVFFDYISNFWLVDLSSARFNHPVEVPLFVGQCPAHVLPKLGTLVRGYVSLKARLDPRAIASDEACNTIAAAFPHSIGMRVFTFGFMEILYADEKRIRQDCRNTAVFPDTISGMHYSLKVVEIEYLSNIARPEADFVTPNEILDAVSPQALYFVTGKPRDALIAGADYWWERQRLKTKRAIIWRTLVNDWSTTGESSGDVCLYLGNPAAETRRAALFQNYESHTVESKGFWRFGKLQSFRGGFIMPAVEIGSKSK